MLQTINRDIEEYQNTPFDRLNKHTTKKKRLLKKLLPFFRSRSAPGVVVGVVGTRTAILRTIHSTVARIR